MIQSSQKAAAIQTVQGRYGAITFFTADLIVGQSIKIYGEWAENEIAFLRRFIRPGDTVLDLGANIGTHTLAFAQAVGVEGRVIAFEPRPEIFEVLAGTIGQNGLTNVALHQAAIGAAEGVLSAPHLDLGIATNFGGLSLSDALKAAAATAANGLAGAHAIPVMTVDGLKLTDCALIKIDVEGAEPAVLAGARGTIEVFRPILYAECNSVENALAIKQFYDSIGYSCFLHLSDAFNANNFFGSLENIFSNSREAALLGYAPSKERIVPGKEAGGLLLPADNPDAIVFGLLQKPQFFRESLECSTAGRSYLAATGQQGAPYDRLAATEAQLAASLARCKQTEAQLSAIIAERNRIDAKLGRAQAAKLEGSARENALSQIVSDLQARESALTLTISQLEEKFCDRHARLKALSEERLYLLGQLDKAYRRPWRSIKYYTLYVVLKVLTFVTKPLSPRAAERFKRSAQKRSPRLFRKMLAQRQLDEERHFTPAPDRSFAAPPDQTLAGEPDQSIAAACDRLAVPPSDPGAAEWRSYRQVHAYGLFQPDRDLSEPNDLAFLVSLRDADLTRIVAGLDFGRSAGRPEDPLVSIIIPCLNHQLFTAECLASIGRARPANFDVEVIVADNASTDQLYAALSQHPTLRTIRFDQNIGYGPACNRAAELARGKFLFFLNNDAQIAPGCLEILVAALEEPEGASIGAVGPKLLSFDGSLQEAGCLLNVDGTGSLIGFGDDESAPRFNYDRLVDHISGAAVLMPRALFEEIGGFDPVFAPAYCEDADLSLKIRAQGKRLKYVHAAVVAHHLSVTFNSQSKDQLKKRQRISRNRNILVKKWADTISVNNLRTIAFYLPQYHPVAENNLWWGKGFTEWTNVTKAFPNYEGHKQPRFPADLGYYDLRLTETMEEQVNLAQRYGITGFCYYYYWFGGKRMLEAPLERMLASGRPDFPFCLCWANENWTRRWDGQANDILLGQDYSPEHNEAIIVDIIRYLRSRAYIRINGRPLILIYRVQELTDPLALTTIWRNECRKAGVGEICIAIVESFELAAHPKNPALFGCDLSVEFPPHLSVEAPVRPQVTNPNWKGEARDYRALAQTFMQREEPSFPKIRTVLAGWDNTPRRQDHSFILENANPGAFQAWLEWTYRRTLEQNHGDERIVFINAWNEWCEGSYLEPDRLFGHSYLQAVSNAQEAVRIGGEAFVEVSND